MIPYFMTNASLSTAILSGACMAGTSLLTTLLLLFLTFALHGEQRLFTLSLLLLLPCAGITIVLPLLSQSATAPFLQGFLLSPHLLFPLSIPLRTLQRSWVATAQELGAKKMATLRLFWWPLLQKPLFFSLSLSIIFSIVQ